MTADDRDILERLIEGGVVRREEVEGRIELLEKDAEKTGLTQAVVERFAISEETLADAYCRLFGIARMSVANEMESAPARILTEEEIQELRTLPVFLIGLELTLAFVQPPGKALRVHLQQLTGCRVVPVVTTPSDFREALRKYKGAYDRIQRIESKFDIRRLDIRPSGAKESTTSSQTAETSAAEVVDELLLQAVKMGASDIHVEPAENESMIRFRVDGVLQRIVSLPQSAHQSIISVLKSRSGMDMFERAIPQDGRFTLTFADRGFDVRVNTLPLLIGEKMVLRILGKSTMMTSLENLGFSDKNLRMFRSLLHLPNGIILVTGPTGSGKTTTLYSALNEMKDIGRNITTVENPVEYKLPLINQVQTNAERGLTFAAVLRAILRQDPNVILVGEIRDSETGVIATEAAMTGHLVLSTLHTNDAIGAISRLVNLGIASFWVSASVIGVLAQRLVRVICSRCREEYEPTRTELESAGLSGLPAGTTLWRGKGCTFCAGVGYKGRIGIHEILIVTEEMRDIIYGELTSAKLRSLAAANAFRDMYFDGLQKALAGITTVEEVQRVCRRV